ncbi:MAG: hypothetical protein JRI23_28520 [Deltaproteobacteria bacterium]|jgi:hypothetical protein|nr:hypothetical protein [Deltaproteobacteria bacterium]MBW2536044.1 hypothetical protein [Deltaproteobacteria bacterium]
MNRRIIAGLAAAAALTACKLSVPLEADDPSWYAATHQGKDDDAVRDTIDQLLEKDPSWSRGPHGLVTLRDGAKEGIPCRKINPDSFEIQCDEDEEAKTGCEVDLEITDRTFGATVSIAGLTEDDAQLLVAMLLRFCDLREPDPAGAKSAAASEGAGGAGGGE